MTHTQIDYGKPPITDTEKRHKMAPDLPGVNIPCKFIKWPLHEHGMVFWILLFRDEQTKKYRLRQSQINNTIIGNPKLKLSITRVS